jgi:hypothetical protein
MRTIVMVVDLFAAKKSSLCSQCMRMDASHDASQLMDNAMMQARASSLLGRGLEQSCGSTFSSER